MKKLLFHSAVLMVIPIIAFAWVKAYDIRGRDFGKCIRPISDTGYIIVGSSEYDEGGEYRVDILLVHVDEDGDTVWTRLFDLFNPPGREYGESVHQTLGGGFFITGNAYTEEPEYRSYLSLIRTNETGDTLWTRLYEERRAGWGEPTSDGGHIICGSVPAGYYTTAMLLKVDENGDSVWAREYEEIEKSSLTFVQQTTDGGYIASGLLAIDGNTTNCIWVLKVNSVGNVQWSSELTYALWPYCNCVRETSDGGYIIVGGAWDPAGARGMYLFKLDSTGDLSWSKWYDGYLAYRLVETSDGGFAVSTWGGMLKFDGSGNLLWSRGYYVSSLYDIHLTDDFGYIMVGGKAGDQAGDLVILKADEDGVAYDHEVSPSEIIIPQSGYQDYYLFEPQATFESRGKEEVSNFFCHCEIEGSVSSDLTPDYHDSVFVEMNLQPGDEIDITFKKWMSLDTVRAWFKTTFYTTGESDGVWGSIPMTVLFKAEENPAISEEDGISAPSFTVGITHSPQILLNFSGYQEGFHADVFDASGRCIDELHSTQPAGSITWGADHPAGVYFIKPRSQHAQPLRVVLIR